MSSNDNINPVTPPSSDFPSYAAAYATLELCVSRMNRAGPGDIEEADAVIREAGRALAFCRARIEEIRAACSRNLAELS